MRTRLFSLCLVAAIVGAWTAPGARGEPSAGPKFALEGQARALELALGDQGLSLGFAMARVDSAPSARGVAAGQCTILGDDPDPDDLPCNEATTESSSLKNRGEPGPTCAGPSLPAPLNTVLTVDIACGTSRAALVQGTPTTANMARVAEIAAGMDLSGLVPQVEDAKDQVVDQLQEITGQAPEQVRNALDQLLDALDQGQGFRIQLGPASSDVVARKGAVEVTSTASGALIGVLGIPDLNKEGEPIAGTADALEDGLIIIEVGRSQASAAVTPKSATARSEASAALVTVKVRDITKAEPTYVEQPVSPNQSVTVLGGTPLESTITAAASSDEQKEGSAVAAADAVGLHLVKGLQGGLKLGLGRTTAAASVETVLAAAPAEKPPVEPSALPATGGRDFTGAALAALIVAALLMLAARRVGSR